MKKFFTFIAALMAVVAVNATVVTLLPSDFSAADQAATSATKNGVTADITKGTITTEQIRIFKNQTITFTCESAISAVVFTCTANNDAQYGPGCFGAKDGYSYSGKVGTWISAENATSVAFTAATNQVRATKIEVYLDGETPDVVEVKYDTLTIAQAVETATALEDNATSEKSYVIEGFAVNVYPYSTDYKNQDFFLVEDAAKPDSVLKVFRATPTKDGKAYPVVEGDQVRVLGNLMKYVKDSKVTLEVVNTSLTFLKEMPRDTTSGGGGDTAAVALDTITVAKALEIGQALANNGVTDVEYVIKGYTCDLTQAYDTAYKNETFFISDVKGTRTSDKTKAFYVYRGKPNTEKEIGLDALIQIRCKIKNYSGTIENNGTNVPFEVLEQGIMEEIKPLNVAQALEIGGKLESGGVSEEKYEITGYVSNVYTFFNADYSSETVWISDDPESTASSNADGAFEIYRGKPNTKAEVGIGAKVKIVCKIKNHNGTTIENDGTNQPFEVVEASTFVPDTLTVEEAAAIASALEEGKKAPKYSVVKGFIQEAGAVASGVATYKLSQFPNESEGAVQAYKATILKADEASLVVNNYVNVTGYLMKKNGGAQVAQGAITAFVEAPAMDTIHVSVTEAVEIGKALEIGGKSDRIYAVTGFVNFVQEEFAEGVESFFLAEEPDSDIFSFYAATASIDRAVEIGAKVEVVGRIQNPDGETITIENGKARYIPGEGIEHIVLTEKVQKVVVDGVIYIVRDNKMYNIHGAQVR